MKPFFYEQPKFDIGQKVWTLIRGRAFEVTVIGVHLNADRYRDYKNSPPTRQIQRSCSYIIQTNNPDKRDVEITVDEKEIFASKQDLINDVSNES